MMRGKLVILTALAVYTFLIFGCSKKAPESEQKELEDGFVFVRGGAFSMGSEEAPEKGEYRHDIHTATISSFYIDPYPVTQGMFSEVMGYNTSWYNDSEFARSAVEGEDGTKRPAERMSWYESIVFCNKLSVKMGLDPVYYLTFNAKELNDERAKKGLRPLDVEKGCDTIDVYDTCIWGQTPDSWSPKWNNVKWNHERNGYRLLTEAEWEYAARGGINSEGFTSAGCNHNDENIEDFMWVNSNSSDKTHETGLKMPNELGLYDMIGNVYVWCWDWFDETYFLKHPSVEPNPEGATSGDFRVCRGRGWDGEGFNLTVYYRDSCSPNIPSRRLGIRLARSSFDEQNRIAR